MSSTALPAYLIVGDDVALKERHRQRFIDRMDEVGSLDFDCHIYDASMLNDITEVCSVLLICPAFSPYRLVVLDHIDMLRAEQLKPLIEYLSSPNPSSILLMTAEKLAKNTRLYKAISAAGSSAIIPCNQPKEYQLHNRIREMAPTYRITIDEAAAKALISLVGTSTVNLASQLERLALQLGAGAHITEQIVTQHVAQSAEINQWKLVDYIFSLKRHEAFEALQRIDDSQCFSLCSALVFRLRQLITLRSLEESGMSAQSAQILKLSGWPLQNAQQQARRFSLTHLQRCLSKAACADQRLKSGYDKRSALIELVGFIVRAS